MQDFIRIVVVDDHELFRQSLISVLEQVPNFKIIGQAGNGKCLLKLLLDYRVDLILLDIEMPEMNGLAVMETIKSKYPAINVVFLSMHNEVSLISDCFALGAKGFLAKSCNIEVLVKAIKTVARNELYFDSSSSKAIVSGLIKEKKSNCFLKEVSITAREKQILVLICKAKTSKEISKELSISLGTVDFHRQNLYFKTNSKSIVELVIYAIKNNIVEV